MKEPVGSLKAMLEAVRQAPSPEEVERLLALLEALAVDPTAVAVLPEALRRRVVVAAGRISRPERDEIRRASRGLRKLRRFDEKLQDKQARAGAGIREARVDPVFVAPAEVPGDGTPRLGAELKTPRACYVCKTEFRRQHFFYDAMCPECGEFNYSKRFQTASLKGRAALVTGARVKIGFQTALKLLRAGARVISTTRFPHDAAQRYAKEPDFPEWKDRLRVYGIDLRHSPSVEVFCRHLLAVEGRLDILVNNACQTVRRPPGWHAHLLDRELAPVSALPAPEAALLSGWEQAKASLNGTAAGPGRELTGPPSQLGLASWHGGGAGLGLRESARLSLIPYDYDDAALGREVFPAGALDADLQQVDLRAVNSWRLKLADVPTAELLELLLVNAVAPFVLNARLKPLLLRDRSVPRFVINVSAMEGIFSRGTKTDRHPHTNMAKAALNMLTLTAARDYALDGIYMNAVDTGWVTDEDPAALAARKVSEHDFQPPLDIVDGAARLCDPVFTGLGAKEPVFGKFLKDYRVAPW